MERGLKVGEGGGEGGRGGGEGEGGRIIDATRQQVKTITLFTPP